MAEIVVVHQFSTNQIYKNTYTCTYISDLFVRKKQHVRGVLLILFYAPISEHSFIPALTQCVTRCVRLCSLIVYLDNGMIHVIQLSVSGFFSPSGFSSCWLLQETYRESLFVLVMICMGRE